MPPKKTSQGRVPEAFRLIKSLTPAEARFHSQLRQILRRRSERSDRLYDLFRAARTYSPEILIQALGDDYTAHNAAMLMKLLKHQVLYSLKVLHENARPDLLQLSREACRILESERLGKEKKKTSSPHTKNQPSKLKIQKEKRPAQKISQKNPAPAAQENVAQAPVYDDAASRPNKTDTEPSKAERRLAKWWNELPHTKPEKSLKKWKGLQKSGLISEEHTTFFQEILKKHVENLAANKDFIRAVSLIRKAEKEGLSIPGSRKILQKWLSEAENSIS